jgi:hypothetical protein
LPSLSTTAELDEFSDFRIDSDVGADAIERGAEW